MSGLANGVFWGLLILILLAAPFLAEAARRPSGEATRKAAPGEFIELSQGITHFQWHGPARRPVAVCVHGLTTPSYVWDAIVEGLVQMGFRVLTYDLLGRGHSDKPRGPQGRDFFLRQLDDLLASQDITGEVTLLGYSMGGSIATAYGCEKSDRLQRLILLAPAGLGIVEDRMAQVIRSLPILGDWLAWVIGPWLFRRSLRREPSAVPDIFDRMAYESRTKGFARSVLASQRGLLAADLSRDHKKIAQAGLPVLAIWGETDDVIPLTGLGRLAQINREARQVSLNGVGHGLAYTHPREVMEAIREFLREE